MLKDDTDKLWGTTIEKFQVDLPNHRVIMEILRVDKGITDHVSLVFNGVTYFGWVNDNDNVEEWKYAELTTIYAVDDIKVKFDGEYISNYSSMPNLLIEIWNSVLLIRATSIKINDSENIL